MLNIKLLICIFKRDWLLNVMQQSMTIMSSFLILYLFNFLRIKQIHSRTFFLFVFFLHIIQTVYLKSLQWNDKSVKTVFRTI